MKALIRTALAAGAWELQDVPEPACGPEDVIVEVAWAAICGSDHKAYTKGSDLGGIGVAGHEFAGTVAKTGPAVTDWKVGDRVVSDNTGHVCGKCRPCLEGHFTECVERKLIGGGMDGGFAKYVRIPGEVLRIHKAALMKIPDEIPLEYAAILDPICNAYRAVCQNAHPLPGETALIFGPGTLGLLSCRMAALSGCANVILVGHRPFTKERQEMAYAMGATTLADSSKDQLDDLVAGLCNGSGADFSVECSGSAGAFIDAILLTRKRGTVVRAGAGPSSPNLPLDMITYKALRVIGHHAYDAICWKMSMNLLAKKMLDPSPIITHRLSLDEWQTGMDLLTKKEAVKVLLKP